MVTREGAWPAGTPCWVDLGVDDIARAGEFYAGLFGWDIRYGGDEVGGYSMCLAGGREVAGIGPKQGLPEAPVAWTIYLACDDTDATAAAITAAGGQILAPPMDVMEAGRMAVAADPGGAVFGLWQAGQFGGFRLANEPGSVIWNENFSRDFDQNKAFYQAVYGFSYSDVPGADFRYATMKLGDAEVAGIGELGPSFGPGVPAHWSTYFAVDDVDATASAVKSAGGAVIREPWDTPYGRMAVARDNQGAYFSLMATAPAGP